MNFFDAKLTGTKDRVCVEFEGNTVVLPKAKSEKIPELDKYLNTGKEVVFGVRPEDMHDEASFISSSKDSVVNVVVDVVEKQALVPSPSRIVSSVSLSNRWQCIMSIASSIF